MSDENYYECTLEKEGFLGTFYPGTQYPDSRRKLVEFFYESMVKGASEK